MLFNASDDKYGIFIQDLKILLEVDNVFNVPKAPDYIWGVINHRGRIITIVDLSLLIGLRKPQRDDSSRIIVIDSSKVDIGLFVSQVFDFVTVTPEQLRNPPGQTSTEKEERFVQNLFEYNDSVVSVLDKDKLEHYLFELKLS